MKTLTFLLVTMLCGLAWAGRQLAQRDPQMAVQLHEARRAKSVETPALSTSGVHEACAEVIQSIANGRPTGSFTCMQAVTNGSKERALVVAEALTQNPPMTLQRALMRTLKYVDFNQSEPRQFAQEVEFDRLREATTLDEALKHDHSPRSHAALCAALSETLQAANAWVDLHDQLDGLPLERSPGALFSCSAMMMAAGTTGRMSSGALSCLGEPNWQEDTRVQLEACMRADPTVTPSAKP